jgi:prepilin-type N-terminal cleavage/methylation domain-containing protein
MNYELRIVNKVRGFTLIELLVVISIIALLSSVVLSSLNGARTKASDNAVKAAMKQIAIQAENYRDTSGGFGTGTTGTTDITANTACNTGVFNDNRINQIELNILANAAASATYMCSTGSSGKLWAFSVTPLKGGGGWCVDNSSGFKASATNAAGVCS